MELYYKKVTPNDKVIRILGIQIYRKTVNPSAVKRKYLYGLFKKITCSNSVIKYYILGIQVFKKTNPITLDKIYKRIDDIYYNMQVLTQVPIVHKYFKQYKNCNRGKDVILFAGGPTVKYYNNELKNALKCGVNGIIAIKDDLNYLFAEDIFIWDKNLNAQIDAYQGDNCQKFYGILPPRRIKSLNKFEHFTERIAPINIYNANANVFLLEDVAYEKWAADLEVEAFGDFGGSVSSALQFLAYTQPRRIYLCGCDCSKAKLAYHSDRPSNSDNTKRISNYVSFKKFADVIYPNIEIISINPVGLRGLFNDVYTQSYLDDNPELKYELGGNVKILDEVENLANV